MNREIIDYYDRLAPTYDRDRFDNSYGRFIDAGERRLLARWLPADRHHILEVACGTGRLSDFAGVACDASLESLKLASRRQARVTLVCADSARLPFKSNTFDAVFAFHLLMHLDAESVRATLAEASRVLLPGGLLVADVLSATRRHLLARSRPQNPWHGNTTLSAKEFRMLCAENGLTALRVTGLAFLPIQRMPHRLRPFLTTIDAWLAAGLPSLSSYVIGCFVKDDTR
jgi:ubiquinone/menaquinone biosynthesis C-methylase UbiE